MDIGIHIYDIATIPHSLRKRKDVRWHVYYPDELKTSAQQTSVRDKLKTKNFIFYGNQEWPQVWATHTVNQIQYSIEVNPTPQCHFTVLNRKPRKNRIDIMNQLNEYKLLDSNYYSWLDTQVGDLPYRSSGQCTFPMRELDNNMEDEFGMWSVPSVAFGNSAASVVIESDAQNLFITEKTFIPLYQKRLPLVFGAPGLYQTLISWGFEFPPQINLQALCSDKDTPKHLRISNFVDEIKNITDNYSPTEMVNMYKPFAEKNKENLIKIALNFPKSYHSWKRKVPRWAKSASHFIRQIEDAPNIGI